MAGRLGILRVYVPMFMLAFDFFSIRSSDVVLVIACPVNAKVLIAESRANSRDSAAATVLGRSRPNRLLSGAAHFLLKFHFRSFHDNPIPET
ncbi:hypothetical protein LMTR13_10660 [Bradyrhizobium icense]|uniref:Uncharacterized protein n=2 Tax=Bradyrhizobium icense TaxID=1274631 RepID=A0A1B1UCS0_9BRAD|nr:hypothetical protein LMTR13_10660 [Bradyrhizobium icense]